MSATIEAAPRSLADRFLHGYDLAHGMVWSSPRTSTTPPPASRPPRTSRWCGSSAT
ncbi:hypothetical protein [Streptomyces sp. NPDC002580]|uniref:hypothetical protein n=1 Tax=Streptomyces sp. NPDC002580 TaxID=3364653 RepID=UPI0036A267B9